MSCEEDREFAEILAQLRRAHAESVGEADLAAVRARVLGRLHPKRRWWPVWAGGLAAAMLALLLFFWAGQPLPHHRTPTIASNLHTEPRPQGSGPEHLPPTPKPKRLARVRRAPKPRHPAEPLVVKLVTDDPDVVIYWIIDAKGD